jgi:hypothetical protein
MTRAEPSPLSRHPQFASANIYRCLAPCKECTGNYISELLQKRFVCNCRCHKITENDFGSAIPDVRGQENDEKSEAVAKGGGT